MFERFTERARLVIVLAQQEARALNNHQIEGPHILLGLVAEEEGVGSKALTRCGVDLGIAREAVQRLLPVHPEPAEGPIPFTSNAKKILEATLREALSLGHNYIGTEHLLLGLLATDDGSCASVLDQVGVKPEDIVDKAFELLGVEDPRKRSRLRARVRDRAHTFVQASQGQEEVVAEEEQIEAIEAIPTHQDRPATEDELGRARLAEVLGERIRRVRGENTEAPATSWRDRRRKRRADTLAGRSAGSFMVHIHAPWGAGKSSLLNFLAAHLRNRREPQSRRVADRIRDFTRPRRASDAELSQWIVVEFNAWEHQRLTPPWWWLLASMQRSCKSELWRAHRGRWAVFWLRDLGWRLWNARAAVITASLLAALIVIAWGSDWFGLDVSSLTALQGVLLTVGSVIALATSLLGIATGTGRWLAIGTAAGADRFLRRAPDPLGVYRRRFRWLVLSSGQPITVFIDDLDRCRPEYVVELLEGIQTLFAAESVTYVVAADRTWLCQSFAHGYQEFESAVGELGRPLGFLFLEKTFQISTEIPQMSQQDRERYWSGLLRGGGDGGIPDPGPNTVRPASDAFAGASTQGEVENRIDDLISSGADGEVVLAAAMRRLNAPDMQEQLEKLLAEFAPLLENNPRSMKRLMNAYGIERDRLLRDGRLLTRKERRQLVLLTTLRLRWPLLAEHLRRCPTDASHCSGDTKAPDDHDFAPLFGESEVQSLFDGSQVEERLDAKLITQFPADSTTDARPASTA